MQKWEESSIFRGHFCIFQEDNRTFVGKNRKMNNHLTQIGHERYDDNILYF